MDCLITLIIAVVVISVILTLGSVTGIPLFILGLAAWFLLSGGPQGRR